MAKPRTNPDGTQDILHWDCVVPGKKDTIWGAGRYPVHMVFTDEYPSKPPECKFGKAPNDKPLFHPNVYPSGKICLSLLDADKASPPPPPLLSLPPLPSQPPRSSPSRLSPLLPPTASQPLPSPTRDGSRRSPSNSCCSAARAAHGRGRRSLRLSLLRPCLVGIQTLLDDPNVGDPAQEEPYRVYNNNRAEYERRVKEQARLFANM